MGWAKDRTAEKVGEQARAAYASGQRMFATILTKQVKGPGEIDGWSSELSVIEQAGWRLVTMSVTAESNLGVRTTYGHFVFRRYDL